MNRLKLILAKSVLMAMQWLSALCLLFVIVGVLGGACIVAFVAWKLILTMIVFCLVAGVFIGAVIWANKTCQEQDKKEKSVKLLEESSDSIDRKT